MKWKIVICQHPMPLLIQKGEDEILEREPPWGELTLEDYLDRIERNLKFTKQHKDFKINFGLSAMELELIEEKRPNLVEKIKNELLDGKVNFVGGTYSQPHLHILGSESNFLQFKFGHKTFNKVLDHSFNSYARQEVGVHAQLPQILNYFNYKYATVPAFYWTLDFGLKGVPPSLIGNWQNMAFLRDSVTCHWEGLDGSRVPLFLEVTDRWEEEFFFRREQKDLFGESELYVFFPDMLEIDEDFAEKLYQKGTTFLLDEALKNQFSDNTPSFNGKLYSYWSYAEGTKVEQTLRKNNLAISNLKQLESIDVLLKILGIHKKQVNYEKLWKRILSTQHHDVYWCETEKLKEEAEETLENCLCKSSDLLEYKGKRILKRVKLDEDSIRKVLVFNPLPYNRTDIVKLSLSFNPGELKYFSLKDAKGKELPHQYTKINRYKDGTIKNCKCYVLLEIQGLGYKTFSIHLASASSDSIPSQKKGNAARELIFENSFFTLIFSGVNARISNLYLDKKKETEFFGKKGAGFFGIGRTNRGEPYITGNSKIIEILEGPIFSELTIITNIHEQNTSITSKIKIYRDLPRMDFSHELKFNNAKIGNLWEDNKKLNWLWEFGFEGEITHNIPFGNRKEKNGRPILCPNWVDYSNKDHGLAISHISNPKFWTLDRLLGNVIAWGGNKISNRQHHFWTEGDFDLTLDGTYKVNHSVFPHLGDWQDGNIPRKAQKYQLPLVGIVGTKGSSCKNTPSVFPRDFSLCNFEDRKILVSAIKFLEGTPKDFLIRFFESYGQSTSVEENLLSGEANCSVENLEGKKISKINPYQIGQIYAIHEGLKDNT